MSNITILAPESGSDIGDVVGPASSTDNAIVRWDGTTGKLIQNSDVIIDDSDNITGVTSMTIDGATGNVLVVDTDTFVVDATNNRVGIGQAAPTASLHIKAGSALAGTAPIKLTAGTVMTAPEAGAIEFDGTNLFYTTVAGPTRVTVGNVTGPALSTDNALARFDGVTGKIIQNSGVIVDDSDNVSGVTSMNIDGTTGNTLVVDTDTFVVDATNNRVGIGQAAPTASLHIKAGTAAAGTAPIKLTAGTVMTAPEAGAIEFDGTNLFYTTVSGPTRVTVGNVTGPASSTDNALARFDGTTGKVIQNSSATLDDTGALTVIGLTNNALSNFNGGQSIKRTATATDYNVLVTDFLVAITNTSVPRTITLPNTGLTGIQTFCIKDESGGAQTNNITINVQGGVKTIDGASSLVINGNYDGYSIYYDGTNYFTW